MRPFSLFLFWFHPGKREKMKKAVDTTTIGGRIKAKRVEAGLSQEKLSFYKKD